MNITINEAKSDVTLEELNKVRDVATQCAGALNTQVFPTLNELLQKLEMLEARVIQLEQPKSDE